MEPIDPGSHHSSGRSTKVAQLIDEYGLDKVGDELERLWTAEGDERMSLRSLAEYFNKELMAEAIGQTGPQPLDGEIENTYRLLAGEDVSDAERARTRRRLERDGIDVDSLLDDFVTYQAIRTYLKDHRGAEYPTEGRDRIDIEAEHIQRLRGRTASVTESKLEQLRNGGHLKIGNVRTFVDISVHCEDCGQQFSVDELIELERCGCDP